jgi:hypothetical protein
MENETSASDKLINEINKSIQEAKEFLAVSLEYSAKVTEMLEKNSYERRIFEVVLKSVKKNTSKRNVSP